MTGERTGAYRLVLDGPLTIRTAERTHASLLQAVVEHAEIEIDCSTATEADISLIQLLLAARASARKAGKTLRLLKPADGVLLGALSRGGFLVGLDGQATPDEAFWINRRSAQ